MAIDKDTARDLREAVKGLEQNLWAALPALARLDAAGKRVVIDREASQQIGTPVVILTRAPRAPEGLTRRQGEIALAIAQGLSNAEIAHARGIALATVKDHVHAILTRLALHRRTEIAAACHGHDPKATTPDR